MMIPKDASARYLVIIWCFMTFRSFPWLRRRWIAAPFLGVVGGVFITLVCLVCPWPDNSLGVSGGETSVASDTVEQHAVREYWKAQFPGSPTPDVVEWQALELLNALERGEEFYGSPYYRWTPINLDGAILRVRYRVDIGDGMTEVEGAYHVRCGAVVSDWTDVPLRRRERGSSAFTVDRAGRVSARDALPKRGP